MRGGSDGCGGTTDTSSAPSGTNTPSASRYWRKDGESGRTTVDLMVYLENWGYQEENWKARMACGAYRGNRGGSEKGTGMV